MKMIRHDDIKKRLFTKPYMSNILADIYNDVFTAKLISGISCNIECLPLQGGSRVSGKGVIMY